MMVISRIVFYLLLFLWKSSTALIHDIAIIDDVRSVFKMETFGFVAGGLFHL